MLCVLYTYASPLNRARRPPHGGVCAGGGAVKRETAYSGG